MEVSPLPVKESTQAMGLYNYCLLKWVSLATTKVTRSYCSRPNGVTPWYPPCRRRRGIIFPGYFGTRSGRALGSSNGALCTVGKMEGSRGLYPYHPRSSSQAGCCTLQRKTPFACEESDDAGRREFVGKTIQSLWFENTIKGEQAHWSYVLATSEVARQR